MNNKLSENEENALYRLRSFLSRPSTSNSEDTNLAELMDKLQNERELNESDLNNFPFANWVSDSVKQALSLQSLEPHTLAYKLLTKNSEEAELAWKGLHKREGGGFSGFARWINFAAYKADCLEHPSLRMLSKDRKNKIEKLKKHLSHSLDLYDELSLSYNVAGYQQEQHFLKFFKNSEEIAKDKRDSFQESLSEALKQHPNNGPDLNKQILDLFDDSRSSSFDNIIFPLNIEIKDLIIDQISYLERFEKMNNLPSPNSPNARRNHFIRNWVQYTCISYGSPLWEISATVTKVLFNDPSVTFSTVRDVIRKHDNGKFYENLQSIMKKVNK
jgi:hypothetical protein